jgi:catechol 2,3-dioxygenase-like lactoylglutathione lyase family enzyme
MTPTLMEPVAPPEAASTATTTFFHLSLLVADLERSLAFYRVLFNCEPSKAYPGDYAEFEVPDPPLLLALTQCPGRAPGGALNHIGLRFSSEAAVANVAKRLEAAGLPTRKEEQVACCYARQTKCWTTDPDHNLWEIYVLFHDLNYNGYGGKTAARRRHPSSRSPSRPTAGSTSWAVPSPTTPRSPKAPSMRHN